MQVISFQRNDTSKSGMVSKSFISNLTTNPLFVVKFPTPYPSFLDILWTGHDILMASSLINEWNKIFDTCSFIICLSLMILAFGRLDFST